MFSKVLFLILFFAHCFADTPWMGESRPDGWWQDHHKALLKQTAEHKGDLKVIFFGDSITEFWANNGKEVWNKYYAPRHAYNYGIGGDRIQHLIWRMEHGEFDGYNSKFVVLKIGTNNLGENTEEDIAKGIRVVLDMILKRQSNAKVLLLAILPRNGVLEKKVQGINTIISKYEDNKRVFYLDMSSHFQTAPGVEIKDLYVDTVHLTPKGYEEWHKAMEPLFSKLLA